MKINETRTMMDSVRTLMESKYVKIEPLKYTENSYIGGKTYSFEKRVEKDMLEYSLSLTSSKSALESSISDIHYKPTMKNYDSIFPHKKKFLMSFKAYNQRGKIDGRVIDEINVTVANIVLMFTKSKTYEPDLIILNPVAEEKYLDTDLINKTLSKNWTIEKYLDENDSVVYLFIKTE